MLHPAWIEREAPLARCPLKACRRDKTCHHSTGRDPCRRLHETKDEMRYKLARKIEAYTAEIIRKNPDRVPHPYNSPAQQRQLHAIHEFLREADEADWQREKAAAGK